MGYRKGNIIPHEDDWVVWEELMIQKSEFIKKNAQIGTKIYKHKKGKSKLKRIDNKVFQLKKQIKHVTKGDKGFLDMYFFDDRLDILTDLAENMDTIMPKHNGDNT